MSDGAFSSWFPVIATVLAVLLGLLLAVVVVAVAWRLGRAAGRDGAGLDMRRLIAAARARERKVLAVGFAAILDRLRVVLPGPGWRYAAPWVLLLGAPRSGRSALASAIDLHRPFVLPVDPEQAELGCLWHVFGPGIVLEPARRVLWGETGDGGVPPPGWHRLLELLLHHRRERGIDGVVVTVACAALQAADLAPELERARLLRERLRELQHWLGLRVPVYVVVTGCDAVAGFTAFWRPLAVARGRQMVGWSNDETPETGFSVALIGRAFDELGKGLHRILLGQAVNSDGIADLAFLFPAEFQALATPVGRFAEALLHVDAYQDPHFFRGLYFTGDVPTEAPAAAEATTLPGPVSAEAAPIEVIEHTAPHPLFVSDLFSEKVFREGRLVQAVRRGMAARSRSARLRWIGLALMALVLAVGTWMSARPVSQSAETVTRLVNQIKDARAVKNPETAFLVKPVLDAFQAVGLHGLVAPFLPASWFSPLERNVRIGLVDGFELVVFIPMLAELEARVQASLDSHARAVVSPELDAFVALRTYVSDLDGLAAEVTRYDQANRLPPDELAALMQRLLGIDGTVGEALRSDKSLYAEVMKNVEVVAFDPKPFQERAHTILRTLVHAAAKTIDAEGGMVAQFRGLAEAIRATAAARFSDPLVAAGRLKELERKLRLAREALAALELGWRLVLHPEKEPVWVQRMAGIRDNPFLGEAVATEMLNELTGKVAGMRTALLALQTPETGPLLVADAAHDGRLRLTPALEALAEALPPVLAFDFFSDGVRQPVAPYPRSNLVLWAPEPLERAVASEAKFKEMEAGALTKVPDPLRPMIKAVAAQSLQGAMLSAVADAEVLEKRGADFRQFGDDATLSREARQFGRAAVALGKVQEALRARGFDQAYAVVADIVGQHALAMLEQADRLLEEGGAWMPVDRFRSWDGVMPMNFEGYQVLSDPELDQVLKNAAARVEWLASEIAKPVVAALQGEAVPAPVRTHPRVVRWTRILKDLERYKAANPASSLATLERYIRVDLAAIKPGACPDAGTPSAAVGVDGSDFFTQRLQTVRQFALAQCQRTAGVSVKTDFDRIAADFNATLAGRYPFADPSAADVPDAAPDAIAGFFERFGPATELAIRRVLAVPGAGRSSAAALQFIDRLAAVRTFMTPLLVPATSAPAALEVEAEFRTNRQRDTGGNQIIEWSLDTGDQRLVRGGAVKSAKWRPGDPVTLKLRWARNAPVAPISVIGGNGAITSDRALTASYDGQWGLIRLLQIHHAPAADLPGLIDRLPVTLKFGAETGAVAVAGGQPPARTPLGGRTNVFVRVSVVAVDADGKTRKAQPLPAFTFADMAPGRLRLHLNADPITGGTLYELMLNQVVAVGVRPGGAKEPARLLPASAVRPVGFRPEEDVLPWPNHAHAAYRLMQEYFVFPEKFLFLDIEGLGGFGGGAEAELLFLLSAPPRRPLPVNARLFRLNCAPMVNLFRRTTEPVRLDHLTVDYRLMPDSHRERSTEIHSILKVSASSAFEDDSTVFQPFYAFDHTGVAPAVGTAAPSGPRAFWLGRREPTGRADLPGGDMILSFVDLDFKPARPPTQVVFAHTLCTNRGVAAQIPVGARLEVEVDAPLVGVVCLTKPTRQFAPPLAGETLWRLVSHLSLNRLSLSGGESGLAALREILALYAAYDDATVRGQLAGLAGLSCRDVVRRIGNEAWRGFCRGTEVRLELDEERFVGAHPFLLASVLNHFFGLYAALNSFTQLVLTSRQRPGLWKTWQPLVGDRAVL